MTEVTQTRDAVLAAALAVFTEHTYGGTRMAQVAARAGVAVGTIYRHFPSKEALGNAVYRRWKEELLGATRRGLTREAGAGTRAAITGMWRETLRFAMSHPEAYQFLERQQHESYLDDDSRAVSVTIRDMVLDVIRHGQDAGEIRAGDPLVFYALLCGGLAGLATISGSPDVPEKDLVAAEDAAWAMLRADTA